MFTAANELVLGGRESRTGFACIPCFKALVRDVHRFQSKCGLSMRRIPLM
jgi:hypothetical protein